MRIFLGVAAVLACSGLASGQVWDEIGDAPDLPPGQITVGVGSLDTISGSLIPGVDVDMYCISILDVDAFSATTVGGASWDTQMWLFDVDGLGVSFKDDDVGSLQSTLTGTFVTDPGIYFLAVSRYSNDALDIGGSEIWLDSPFTTERAPDGPGAPGPIAGWDGAATGTAGFYHIFLTGAGYHVVPAPASLALIGLGGLVAMRRRRA